MRLLDAFSFTGLVFTCGAKYLSESRPSQGAIFRCQLKLGGLDGSLHGLRHGLGPEKVPLSGLLSGL